MNMGAGNRKRRRKRGKDEFAVFVVAAAIICFAAIMYGLLIVIPRVRPTIVRVYVPVNVHQTQQQTVPDNGWIPIVNGKG